jgi:hypothetical protein
MNQQLLEKITLTFTPEETDKVFEAVMSMPFKDVEQIINKMRRQVYDQSMAAQQEMQAAQDAQGHPEIGEVR